MGNNVDALHSKKISIKKALARFAEGIEIFAREKHGPNSDIYHDAIIQCFEFTFAAFLQYMRAYTKLRARMQNKDRKPIIRLSNPRTSFQTATEYKLLSSDRLACLFDMTTAKEGILLNYEQGLEYKIVEKIPAYYELMRSCLVEIENQLPKQ